MIIIDLNQVIISSLMAQLGNNASGVIEEDLLRHMVLNNIRSYRSKFGAEYGELVIACDGKKSWRRDAFPYYKAHRKKLREESKLDWNSIFVSLNTIRDELKEYFPYKHIHVDGAEADDVIGTLCLEFGTILGTGFGPILILSGDKDFVQLQKYNNVSQYDPVRKKWIKHSQPELFMAEHIMKGDRGDGIPNMSSKDDCFINGRQTPLRSNTIRKIIGDNAFKQIKDWTFENPVHTRNFARNRVLIDLDCTPNAIRLNIMEQYNAPENNRNKLFGYFIEKKLKNLMEHIGEF